MRPVCAPIIVVAGPTAVGKTDCAITLAQKLNAEIISADSMQVYKTMDIGTAKPTREQMQQVRHHAIDLVNPDENFTVADYQRCFEHSVAEIESRGKLPLMVGGTGLYIRASLRSFPFTSTGGPEPALRGQLREEADRHGIESLYQRLQNVDPLSAERIHHHDSRRIIRALEVYLTSGQPLSSLDKPNEESKYQTVFIFLDRDRTELYQRIEYRVDRMMADGFIEEVEGLLAKGYSPQLKSMQSLGYKQIAAYLNGEITLPDAVSQMKQLTRNYAKRQLTWFRREPVDHWVNLTGKETEFFGDILNYIEGRMKDLSNSKI